MIGIGRDIGRAITTGLALGAVLVLAVGLLLGVALGGLVGGCTPPVPPTLPDPVVVPGDAGAADSGAEPAPCEYLPSSRSGRLPLPRIVGGSPAPEAAYPWMVSLETRSGWHYCGGSVIGGEWVLTAAHCQVSPGDVAHLGTVDLREPGRRVSVAEVRNHPSWYATTSGHDVAVLRLDAPANVEPVAMAMITPVSGDATAVGWGATSEGGDGSDVLLEVDVPIVPWATCQRLYGGALDGTMVCAGESGADACQGDSGGPLLDAGGAQIGVTSWGRGCARPGAPGVYTDVVSVREWVTRCAR